jgi:CdiI N-terminal domain
MFSIRFGDAPAYAFEGSGSLTRDALIVIDEFEETFDVPLDFWSEGDYERQWLEGAERIVRGERTSCLVSWMQDPDFSPILRWWSLYRRNGPNVIVREQLCLPEFGRVDPKNPYVAVQPYGEDALVSEWMLTVDDLSVFASDG